MPSNQVVRRTNRAGQNAVNPVAQSWRNLGLNADRVRSASWFIYSTPAAVALAVSGTGTSNIQIQADSVFQLRRIAAFAHVTATPQTAAVTPPILIQIQDTSSGANLFDTAVPLFNVAYCGAGFGPFDLPDETQRYFAPNATVTLSFTNLDAASTYVVRVGLQGNKLFA